MIFIFQAGKNSNCANNSSVIVVNQLGYLGPGRTILGLQPRDKAAMLGDKTIKKNFHRICKISVQFPVDENTLFLSTKMAAMM